MASNDPVTDGGGVLDEALKRRLKAMPKRQQPDHQPLGGSHQSHDVQQPQGNDQAMELRGQGLRSDG